MQQGVVAGVRKVAVSPDGTLGGTAGAAAGGIGGAQAPGSGVRTALTALGGSVVGGLVGSGIERAAGEVAAFEYIVRKGKGELVSVNQRDPVPLALGQRVLVIAGAQARIVPNHTVPATPPAEPAAAPTTAPEPLAVP